MTGLGPEVAPNTATEVAIGIIVMSIVTVAVITALACVAPALRALRIQPTDPLKST